jgi:hypothetical protein
VAGIEPARLKGPGPTIPDRASIDAYSISELISLLDWINSDGRLRSDQELANELFKALPFKRRGQRIDEKLNQTIAQSHWRARLVDSKSG